MNALPTEAATITFNVTNAGFKVSSGLGKNTVQYLLPK